MQLSVGYNGILDELKQIVEFEKVSSVYTGGIKDHITGCRPQYIKSLDDIEKQAAFARTKNVDINLALNACCGFENKNNTGWWKKITAYFKDLESVGVAGVIISHPHLMDIVKAYTDLKLIASTICEVRTGRAAWELEKRGVDVIIPSMCVNWDFEALRDIKKACKNTKLRIMVNEYCMPDCHMRMAHQNHSAHSEEHNHYFNRCIQGYQENPALFLENSTIRPEDIHLFREFAGEIKIVGRICNLDYILKMTRAYSEERYEGNFLDFFGDVFGRKVVIPNSSLASLAEYKIQCNQNCYECTKCTDLFNKITGAN